VSQKNAVRELVLRNCSCCCCALLHDEDTADALLRQIVPHLERWKLLDGTSLTATTSSRESWVWWEWWHWTEQECPNTAIAWKAPNLWWHAVNESGNTGSSCHFRTTNRGNVDEDTTKSTPHATRYPQFHPDNVKIEQSEQQQQQQQLLQDYLDWNCSLNEWRWHWLKPMGTMSRPARSHHRNELVEAACVVLKAWYRTHHRPRLLWTGTTTTSTHGHSTSAEHWDEPSIER
jgi:hypothetical protein